MIRLLIVGTVPYNTQSPSRAFESYFHGWDENNIAQIFSNPREPVKGHCGTLYQITDQRMLRRWFDSKIETGIIYNKVDLPDNFTDSVPEFATNTVKKMQRFGVINKGAFSHLLRKALWKKRFWCTEKLNQWLDDFQPQCVFLAFSDDFFILKIAMYVAEKYGIPIVSCIGDDYYFNYKRTLSPIYHLYKLSYRRMVRCVFSLPGSAAYIGNKIRDKYNSEFGLNGETVYLTSAVPRRNFKPINAAHPKIRYFGNLLLGRNESLCDIADVLGKINPNYFIDVYSNDTDPVAWSIFDNNPHIRFHGSVPYETVMKETAESDLLLIVEGFDKEDVDITRYSLSTKVADSLASGVSVFGYGSIECGAIEYLKGLNCAPVCTSKVELQGMLSTYLFDCDAQKQNYGKSLEAVEKNHRLSNSTSVFRSIVDRAIECNERTR